MTEFWGWKETQQSGASDHGRGGFYLFPHPQHLQYDILLLMDATPWYCTRMTAGRYSVAHCGVIITTCVGNEQDAQ